MTALSLADAGEAADLAAFLARLLHYDRRAAVRLQAGGGMLAVFGRPAPFEVLAVRTSRLAERRDLDATVSAGQLADAIDTALGPAARVMGGVPGAVPSGELVVTVPEPVTGPPWTGMLPPRGGWRRVEGLPGPEEIKGAVAAAVREFRARIEALPQDRRTRATLDRVGREIWSRPLGDTVLPLRAVHAAQALGFLRPPPARAAASSGAAATVALSSPGGNGAATALAPVAESPALLAAGSWLRLRTPYGSVTVRQAGLPGLTVTPV